MGRKKKEKIDKVDTTKEDRKIRLEQAMREVNKTFGKDTLKFSMNEKEKDRIGFGIKELDDLTGGGAVAGNVIIVYGPSGVGKSTSALEMIANAQRKGKTCLYLDLEHSFDINRAKKIGINLEELILAEGLETAEQAMDLVIKFSTEKLVDLIVLDSIQAMSPKGEQETKKGKLKSVEDDEMALLARKMSKFLRRSATPLYKGNVALLLIGQVRVGGIGSFVTRPTLTGGKALLHWSILTLFMRRGMGVNAPIEKYKEYYTDEKGKERYKTKARTVGFDCCIKIEKSQADKSKSEKTELHLPFYYSSGFKIPKIKEEK